MYAPPRLSGEDLPELLRLVGRQLAIKLCDVNERTLRRWLEDPAAVPLCALRLLWYASAWGRDEAALDIATELHLVRQQVAAVAAEIAQRLPLRRVPDRLSSAVNEPVFTVPVPQARQDAPPWHPAHPRNRRRPAEKTS
jgi:hypothetical protein